MTSLRAPLAHRLRGTGPWLVLLHSLATRGQVWDELAERLLAQGFTVLQIDLRGHGDSPAAGPGWGDQVQHHAKDVAALLRALAAPPVHLLGLSFGGMVAQALALHAPAQLASLSLVATVAENAPAIRQAWDARIAVLAEGGAAAWVQPLLERWLTAATRASDSPWPQRLAAMIAAGEVASLAACSAAVRDVATLAQLPNLRLPSLVLAGAEDPATPPAQVARLPQAIPGAEFHIVEAAAHWLPLEQPQRFEALWRDFLRRLPTQA